MEYGIGIGSNIDNREEHLASARSVLGELVGDDCMECSAIYETEPVGVADRHSHLPFLNAVIIVQSALTPRHFFDVCRMVEDRGGRRRTGEVNAPRTIDLDIIYAGDLVVNDPDLTIPHPRFRLRRFVLAPLAELRPDRILPGEPYPVSKLLDALKENGKVALFKHKW